IAQRMFVTATPTDYTDTPQKLDVLGVKRNKDGSLGLITKREPEPPRIPVRSLGNENLYGPCIVKKTNAECIGSGITVPIKLCCLSKREMFSELGRELNVEDCSRDELAPFAVLAAHSKLGINKIVSYHSSVIRSKDFIEISKPLFEKEGFYLTQVDGRVSRKEQDRRLTKIRSVEKSLVANCQLWREGVDVPEWDMVVMADPVKSPVAVKQIIGRASRPHSDKKIGYVLIPHVFDEETGLEVGGDGYSEFVTVFQALMNDDPQLQRDVVYISAAMKNEGNQTMSVDEYPPRLLEIFQLPNSVPLPVRQNFINNVVTEMGGMFSWMDWYGLLKKYTEREGNCLVPVKPPHIEEGRTLGLWVSTQRQAFKTGAMTVRQKELLDELEFCYDVQLYRWVDTQRLLKGLQQLQPHREQLLDEIGFIWDAQAYRWERSYNLLQRFAEREGHCNVPVRHKEDGEFLGKWLGNQKKVNKEGKLTQE
ncbi:MAG: hypothetical protein SGILL_010354, partial [Bacillariaceae sp.]